MGTDVVMPKFGLIMEKGLIVKWLKKVGDKVEKGEPLLEVETEKATVVAESPATGVLSKILVEEGSEAKVGEVIAIIESQDTIKTAESIIISTSKKTEPEKEIEVFPITPAAKKLAKEHSVDPKKIKGTGPNGLILESDVREFLAQQAIKKKGEIIPIEGMRKVIAELMYRSHLTAPHVTITLDVDMTETIKLRNETGASYNAILIKCVAKALEEYKIVNSRIEGNSIVLLNEINIGLAVATKDGLVVPVIHNANKKSLEEIDALTKEIINKARENKPFSAEEMSGGTFTISNLGMFGVDMFTPIINFPEAAILGIGKINEKTVVIEKNIVIRPMVTLSLSFDHRIMDGVTAAQFLQRVKQLLEAPQQAR